MLTHVLGAGLGFFLDMDSQASSATTEPTRLSGAVHDECRVGKGVAIMNSDNGIAVADFLLRSVAKMQLELQISGAGRLQTLVLIARSKVRQPRCSGTRNSRNPDLSRLRLTKEHSTAGYTLLRSAKRKAPSPYFSAM
jgi:hypothetical protein